MTRLTDAELAAYRAVKTIDGRDDRAALLAHIDALTTDLADAVRSRDLASAWGEEKQMQAIDAVSRAEAAEAERDALRAKLARVEATCRDLCLCDYEREDYASVCDACRIRAAIEGDQQ